MTTIETILPPDPNNEAGVELHCARVLAAYRPLFEIIDQALRESVRRATDLFRLFGGPMDLGVHAANTRYLTRQFLASKGISAEVEDSPEFALDRIPNCGLCLRGSCFEIRILKICADGVPKAASEARSRFYSSNQLQFAFAGDESTDRHARITLNLVVLWDMDASHSYTGLEVACPRGEHSDGRVDCYWVSRWSAGEATPMVRRPTGTKADSDLDEIRAVDVPKAASE